MSPRALQRLDAAIAVTANPSRAACLKAERAGLLARMGRFDEAERVHRELTAQQARAPSASLAAWLALLQGMIDHYRDFAARARESIRNAHALAAGARDRPLLALAAAWRAQMDYIYGDLDGVARHAAEALQEAADDHHAARARASIVVAQSFHWAGRLDRAQPWYERARQHTLEDGDEATLSALMINRAWISGEQLRLATVLDLGAPADNTALRQALLAAESTANFDQHVGKVSLKWWLPMLRAQLLLAQGQHREALALFEAHLDEALGAGLGYMRPVLHADLAWCKLQLGRKAAARADAESAAAGFGPDCEPEDSAGAHGRLAQVYAALGEADRAASHAEQARQDLQALRAQQQRLAEALDKALAQVPGLPVERRARARPGGTPAPSR